MRILCIGDSNTWGYDPQTSLRQNGRWTKLLAKLRPEDEIIEEGMNGRTFCFKDPFHEGRCGIDVLEMLLKSHQPVDLVVVMLGTNDLKSIYSAHAGYIASGALRFIQTIQNPVHYRYPVPEILLISPVHLGESLKGKGADSEFDENGIAQSHILASCLENTAKETGVYFLDAAKAAEPDALEGVHLNGQGHQQLANAIDRKISEIVCSRLTGTQCTF